MLGSTRGIAAVMRIHESYLGKEGTGGISICEKGFEGERNKVITILALWVGIMWHELKRIMQRATRDVPLADVDGLIAVFTQPLTIIWQIAAQRAIVDYNICLAWIATSRPTRARRATDWVGCVTSRKVDASLS